MQSTESVGALEGSMRALSDLELQALTGTFRARLGAGETLDALLPEALAAGREAGVRALGQRAADEQISGAIALCRGRLVEMKTGEGKTLAIALAAYAWSLPGEGVHVVAANSYLADRDAAWMRPLFEALGVSCALISGERSERGAAYLADATYLTPSKAADDYLRDHTVRKPADRVQRPLRRALVDEADLVLIENARFLMSVSTNIHVSEFAPLYRNMTRAVGQLDPERHVFVDVTRQLATLTDAGAVRMEDLLGVADLYQGTEPELLRALDDSLNARFAYLRDRDYVVLDGAVSALNPVTGRIDEAVTPPDGLRQAIEIKEGLRVSPRERIVGQISYHGLLRRYPRLAAATGTALEDRLYREAYGLETERIPTHAPVLRIDHAPIIYSTGEQRTRAALDRIAERRAAGRPVLVVTASIAQCDELAAALRERGIPHEVLTAVNHRQEAEIISRAGRIGAVTVVTRMAGRGVDIRLGGYEDPAEHEAVVRAGGLYVLGFDLYENRRLELHMRGRAGRRGDPGESAVLLSLEDPSTAAHFSAWSRTRLNRMIKSNHGSLDTSILIAGSLEKHLDDATRRLEETMLARFRVDEIRNGQMTEIYRLRDEFLDESRVHAAFRACLASGGGDQDGAYRRRVEQLTEPVLLELERRIGVIMIDRYWPEHLVALEDVHAETTLHGLSGSAWETRYRQEANRLFRALRARIDRDVVGYVLNPDVKLEVDPGPAAEPETA